MLQEYHTTLCDTLNAMGYSKKVITLVALRKDYDDKAICGLFGTCCLLPVVTADKVIEPQTFWNQALDRILKYITENFTRRSYKECCQNLMRKELLNVEAWRHYFM
jgi:hypothetical protein